jgi:glycosyltransferase involved in cell wall biosynthesis
MVETLLQQGMNRDVSIWTRGVDREMFNPARRDMSWRRSHGIGDEEVAVVFLGRLVMEKGLDVFADTIACLKAAGAPHRVLVIGDGPARGWFEQAVPDAVFAGFQTGAGLGRVLASGGRVLQPVDHRDLRQRYS